jgi:hypothetical protein
MQNNCKMISKAFLDNDEVTCFHVAIYIGDTKGDNDGSS